MKVNYEKLTLLTLQEIQIIIEHAEKVIDNYKTNTDNIAKENTARWRAIWEICIKEKLRRIFEIFE